MLSPNTTTSGRTGVADALARTFGNVGAPAEVFCSVSASWPCGRADVGDGVRDRRVDDAAVEHAVAAADHRGAAAAEVVGDAEARAEVVLVLRERRRRRQRRVGNLRLGHLLVVVAQTEVQRRARVEAPRVLDEEVVVERMERERRRADALAKLV